MDHKNGKLPIFGQNSSLFSLQYDDQNWSVNSPKLPNRVGAP